MFEKVLSTPLISYKQKKNFYNLNFIDNCEKRVTEVGVF